MSKSPHDYFIHNALFYGWEESYIIYFMTEKMTADELLNYANTEFTYTPIYFAMFYGYLDVFNILLPITNFAHIDIEMLSIMMLLRYKMFKTHKEKQARKMIFTLLLKKGLLQWRFSRGMNAFMWTCNSLKYNEVKLLLKNFANINIRNDVATYIVNGNGAKSCFNSVEYIYQNYSYDFNKKMRIYNFIRGYQIKYKYIFLCKNISRK